MFFDLQFLLDLILVLSLGLDLLPLHFLISLVLLLLRSDLQFLLHLLRSDQLLMDYLLVRILLLDTVLLSKLPNTFLLILACRLWIYRDNC
jgi:hypothetical protein